MIPLRSLTCVLAASILLLAVANTARGQTLSPQGSGVIADFASQSDAYQDSDPTGQIFGPAGVGPYTAGLSVPGVPPAPAPSIAPAPGNGFSTNGGGGWSSFFTDNLGVNVTTTAKSNIDDTYMTSPVQTSDMAVMINAFRLNQDPAAPGYAYDQLNFGSNYLITTNPGLAPSPSPNFPMTISGNTALPGNYAQADAVIEYTWIPVTVNTAGVITASGPSVSLGTLSWSFIQTGGGPFGTTLISTGGLAATPAGDGIMSLTGHAWLAGDPMNIQMTLLPEPATLGLLSALALTLVRRRRA